MVLDTSPQHGRFVGMKNKSGECLKPFRSEGNVGRNHAITGTSVTPNEAAFSAKSLFDNHFDLETDNRLFGMADREWPGPHQVDD